MLNPSRETIATALFGLINTVTMQATFKTISRRPKVWDAATDMPAIYLFQPEEEYSYEHGAATPPMARLDFDVIIYTNSGLDPNATPDTQMNNCIDALETAIAGKPPGQPQTLGGIVHHAWIEGPIHRAPGYLDGQGMAFLTIRVLVPA